MKHGHLPRLMAVALVSLLALVFAACGSGSGSGTSSKGGGTSATTTGSSGDVTVAGRTVTLDPAIRKQFPAAILSKGQLNLGYAPTPPRIFRSASDNQLTGVDYDFAHAVGALTGLRTQLTESTIDGLIPGIEAQKIDVIWSGLLPTPERLRVLNIVTFTRDAFGLLIPKNNPHQIKTLADLCGLTAAVVEGGAPYLTVIDAQNRRCAATGKGAIKTRTFATPDTAVLAVKTGQVDAEVVITSAAQWAAKSIDGGNALAAVPLPPYLEGGYGFRKQDVQLAKAMQAAIQKLMDDGTLKAIMEQYGVGSLALGTATLHEK